MPVPKKMTLSEVDDLRYHVQGMLQNILRNADAFIFEHEASASEAVSVQVRKLALTDTRSLETYEVPVKHPNLLALAYGGADRILVNSGLAQQRSQDEQGFDLFPAAPALHASPESLISAAQTGARQLTLKEWLNSYEIGCYAVGCRCVEGKQKSEKVMDLLRSHANKEGAHRENRQQRQTGIIITSADTQADARPRDFDVAWQQFVVGAGLKVAFAKRIVDDKQHHVIDMEWFTNHYPHWQAYMIPGWHERLPQRTIDVNASWHVLRVSDRPKDRAQD